jgi:hypothetical protein
MAEVKISNLPEINSADGDVILPVVTDGTTKRIKLSKLLYANSITAEQIAEGAVTEEEASAALSSALATTIQSTITASGIGAATTAAVVTAQAAADSANTLAGSKVNTFSQSTTPTALSEGDLWINTGTNEIYRATSSGTSNWVSQDVIEANSITSDKIAGNSITTSEISSNSITANSITTATIDAIKVTAADITTNAITTNILNSLEVTSTQIAANAIISSKIAANAITSDEIATNQITADQLATNAVTAEQITGSTISGFQISADQIDSGTISANRIGTGTIAACKLTATYLESYSVSANEITAVEIAGNSITSNLIAANQVTGAEVSANAISTDSIAANSITTESIALNNITADLIATNAITADQITGSTISGFSINASQISGLEITSSQITANAVTATEIKSNAVTASEVSANAINSNAILSNSISSDLIAANAITTSEISANSISSTQIAANAISADEIAANTITLNEIAANTITADQIGANAITSDLIAANQITSNEIIANAVTADQIAATAIETFSLSANQITSGTIDANRIGSITLDSCSITADMIAANAITADEVQANAVTAVHVSNNSITTGAVVSNAITSESITSSNLSLKGSLDGDFDGSITGPDGSGDYTFNLGTKGFIFHAPSGTAVINTLVARNNVISGNMINYDDSLGGLTTNSDGEIAINTDDDTLKIEGGRIKVGTIPNNAVVNAYQDINWTGFQAGIENAARSTQGYYSGNMYFPLSSNSGSTSSSIGSLQAGELAILFKNTSSTNYDPLSLVVKIKSFDYHAAVGSRPAGWRVQWCMPNLKEIREDIPGTVTTSSGHSRNYAGRNGLSTVVPATDGTYGIRGVTSGQELYAYTTVAASTSDILDEPIVPKVARLDSVYQGVGDGNSGSMFTMLKFDANDYVTHPTNIANIKLYNLPFEFDFVGRAKIKVADNTGYTLGETINGSSSNASGKITGIYTITETLSTGTFTTDFIEFEQIGATSFTTADTVTGASSSTSSTIDNTNNAGVTGGIVGKDGLSNIAGFATPGTGTEAVVRLNVKAVWTPTDDDDGGFSGMSAERTPAVQFDVGYGTTNPIFPNTKFTKTVNAGTIQGPDNDTQRFCYVWVGLQIGTIGSNATNSPFGIDEYFRLGLKSSNDSWIAMSATGTLTNTANAWSTVLDKAGHHNNFDGS